MPDPRFGDVVVSKLINNVMLDGKKGIQLKEQYTEPLMPQHNKREETLEVFHQGYE